MDHLIDKESAEILQHDLHISPLEKRGQLYFHCLRCGAEWSAYSETRERFGRFVETGRTGFTLRLHCPNCSGCESPAPEFSADLSTVRFR